MQELSKRGPLGTGRLANGVGVTAWTAKAMLQELEAKRLVHRTGATISLRWHLGVKGSVPKEAESRS